MCDNRSQLYALNITISVNLWPDLDDLSPTMAEGLLNGLVEPKSCNNGIKLTLADKTLAITKYYYHNIILK